MIQLSFIICAYCNTDCMHHSCNKCWDTDVVYKYKSDLRTITIEEWRNASLCEIADNIFNDENITEAIQICKTNSLARKLNYKKEPYPHIALARIVMSAFDEKWEAYNIPKVFSSSIDGDSAWERMDDFPKKVLRNLVVGISPYKGSPRLFAHSERAIGVFLEENIRNIIENRSDGVTCLIQIKTSLPPCVNCKNFWAKDTKVNGKNFCKAEEEGIMKDWLQNIKCKAQLMQIGVEISSSADIEGNSFALTPPFFRVSNSNLYGE